LVRRANREDLLRERRKAHVSLDVGSGCIELRDQAPLHEKNVALETGWAFGDLVALLNSLVFFWPGDETGPNRYGRRHFLRYKAERPVILRVETAAILSANPGLPPLFSRHNSGAPRYSHGRPSPRGPDTFVEASAFTQRVGDIVELAFRGTVALPRAVEVSENPDGPWRALSRVTSSVRSPRPDAPDANLLQALEHSLEMVKRLSTVLHSALAAMDEGQPFSDRVIADYRAQLKTAALDCARLEELVRICWTHLHPH
jgi:hypothetical protein